MTQSKQIRCNNCMGLFNESDLKRMKDGLGELDACPKCETDNYLMDFPKGGTMAKHTHNYVTQKSGIKTCVCGRFQHKEGGEVIVEQRAKHTATPWELNQTCFKVKSDPMFWKQGIKHGGIQTAVATGIGQDEAQANAAFIVRAVNSHESLVNALVSMRTAFGDVREHDTEFKKSAYKVCLEALKRAGEA